MQLRGIIFGSFPLKRLGYLFLLLYFGWQATSVRADTTDVITRVGPGVRFHHVTIDEGPQVINGLEIEWPNPRIALKSVLGIGGEQGRAESTSDIVKRYLAAGYEVIGAVNGDYYYLERHGIPTNLHVQDSQLAVKPIHRSALIITDQKKLAIDVFRFRGFVRTRHGRQMRIAGYNQVRGSNELVLYNQYHGKSTRTNDWGVEVVLRPLARWIVNDTVRCMVIKKNLNKGNTVIPKGGAVLSGHGEAATFLRHNVETGDTLQLALTLLPDYGQVVQAVGGGPRLLENGHGMALGRTASESVLNHRFFRHPRTAVGFNKDTTRVFLVTVDGRSDRSRGMTLAELAAFLRGYFRIWNALNLDGGGSTTMVLGEQVINVPSDPDGERPVGNALLIVKPDSLNQLHSSLRMPDGDELYPLLILPPDGLERRALYKFDR